MSLWNMTKLYGYKFARGLTASYESWKKQQQDDEVKIPEGIPQPGRFSLK